MLFKDAINKIISKDSVWYTNSAGEDLEATVCCLLEDGCACISLVGNDKNLVVSLDEIHE